MVKAKQDVAHQRSPNCKSSSLNPPSLVSASGNIQNMEKGDATGLSTDFAGGDLGLGAAHILSTELG